MASRDAVIIDWVRQKLDAERGLRARLARHLGIRPEALSRALGAKGEKRRITTDELDRIAAFFHEAPPLQVLLDRSDTDIHRPATDLVEIPVISWVSAGKLAEASAQIPEADAPVVGFSDLGRGDYFALKVQGDSMDRFSPEGSVIVVNRRERRLQVGKPYVFSIRGEATYKLWGGSDPVRLEPFSTNPVNRTIFPKRGIDDVEVVGRVRRTVLDL